jgi:hypothetical protein
MRFRHGKLGFLLLACGIWPTSAGAGVRIIEPAVDIAEVRAGIVLARTFEVANDGPANAEILEVRGSCGCLKPQCEPRIIAPHGKAKLTLTINTLGQGAGPHSWSARLRYRADGKENDLAAVVSAQVITEVTVQPAELTIIARGTITQLVTLTDIREKHLQMTTVATTTRGLKAHLLGQGHDAQRRWTAKIQLDVTAELEPGRHTETLSLYTDDPSYQQLRVPVTIIKTSGSSVTAVPEQVVLQAAPGAPASCLVRLRASGTRPVRIARIDTGNPALTCKWAAGPGQDATLRIQLDRSRWNDDLDATVRIHFESPAGEILPLAVAIRP